jgi:hypothetical protein
VYVDLWPLGLTHCGAQRTLTASLQLNFERRRPGCGRQPWMSIATDPTINMPKKPLTSTLTLILTDLADAGDFYGRDKNGCRWLRVLNKGTH